MKPEEAIRNIGDWISEETQKRKYDKVTLIELADSLIAIKGVVEKQVAKKPVDTYNTRQVDPIYCPICYNSLTDAYGWEYEYCPNCGQKIAWRKQNENTISSKVHNS